MESTNVVQKKSRKKTLLGVLALVMAVALLCGSLFAFFSDKLTGNGIVNVGTLDLVNELGGEKVYEIHRFVGMDGENPKWAEFDEGTDVLNPGDVLRISLDISNHGSKSAWVHTNIAFKAESVTETDIENLKFDTYFDGDVDTSMFTSEGLSHERTFILDGTKENEVDFKSGDDTTITSIDVDTSSGISRQPQVLYVYLDKDAKNAWQGVNITFDVIMVALQYRNNNTAIPDWNELLKGNGINTNFETYSTPSN